MRFGILGGIGPHTSIKFYQDIICGLQKQSYFKQNTHLPNIIINNIPAPELTELSESENLGHYIDGLRQLVSLEPEFIVMACNTIHVYLEELKEAVGFNHIFSIRDIVSKHLQNIKGKICILATPTTIKKGLYQFDHCQYIDLDDCFMQEIGFIVKGYSNHPDKFPYYKDRLLQLIRQAEARGAHVFLLSCTEVSLLLGEETSIRVIDTLKLLTQYTIDYCSNTIKNRNSQITLKNDDKHYEKESWQ